MVHTIRAILFLKFNKGKSFLDFKFISLSANLKLKNNEKVF